VVGSSRKRRSGCCTSARREHEPPLHPARELADRARSARLERREFQERRKARGDLALREAEVASVDEQVLAHGEIRVEVVHLRHDAHANASLARGLRDRMAEEADLTRVGFVSPSSMRNVVVLPAPFGPSRP
jgi:hypothetical protein